MNSHLEIELKQLISKETYAALLQRFPESISINQVNHYYKYADASQAIACRVRDINQELTLTFKQKHPKGLLETSFKVACRDDEIFSLPEVKLFLNEQNLDLDWSYIGELKTQRHISRNYYGELCIDENSYLDFVDYELEFELKRDTKKAYEYFGRLLHDYDLIYSKAQSKYGRFIERLSSQDSTL